jgi:lauroyl/myristoyl acyltransferase
MPGAHQATLERAVRRCYVHFTLMLNETLRLHRLPRWLTGPKNIRVIDPWHCLQRPIPGPALLCTGHCNWELLLGIAHHQGWAPRSWVHSRSHGDHRIDHLLDRLRASVGARSLHSETAPLASLRSLRLGRLVGMVVDRDYRGDGIPVNMAGQATTIPAGPASLSVQTGAPIIPVLCARRGASAFTVLVGKPLQADAQQPKQQQVLAMSQDLATTLGRFIGAIPSQWMAFHEAWPASLSGPGKTGNRRE